MRIGIDGRALQGFIEGSRAGVGRYVFELCRELDVLLPDAKFYVYSSSPIEMPVTSDRWILRLDQSAWARYLKPVLWSKYRCGKLCKVDQLDIFWGAATFLPELPITVRTITTVYDLNFKVVPDTMSRLHRLAYQLYFKSDVLRADCVTTISNGTSDRLYEFYGRSTDVIVYPAVGPQFTRQSEDLVNCVLESYAIQSPYLLAVGTREPRKNIKLLIEAFSELKDEGFLGDYSLILAGGQGWRYGKPNDSHNQIKSVVSLGYVHDEHLAPLYSGARAFVFPSIYEGFGIPVLEAISCGCRVIATDIPEVREAGGDNCRYVEPTKIALKESILKEVRDKATQSSDVNFFKKNSWSESARALASTFTQ